MKYLINICAHDGIISHYTGVGSIVHRYARALQIIAGKDTSNNYTLNLITPEYKPDSFGYSADTNSESERIVSALGGTIYQVSNGSNGAVNYGTLMNWRALCKNTALLIDSFDTNAYDAVITIFNDTPFAQLSSYLTKKPNQLNVWIPHSTVTLHGADSALKRAEDDYYTSRLDWEEEAIAHANTNAQTFVGIIGNDFGQHLATDYQLDDRKTVSLINGVILGDKRPASRDNQRCAELLETIDADRPILLSYARAEPYKNLAFTMQLGSIMRDTVQTVVIAQSYYPEQEILNNYRLLAKESGTQLFVDPPFALPHYIIDHAKSPVILLVPSKKEAMGLIINEVRQRNNPNVLIVANDIPGLREQIHDTVDGLLINEQVPLQETATKIIAALPEEHRARLNSNSQETLAKSYDLVYNVEKFIQNLSLRINNGA